MLTLGGVAIFVKAKFFDICDPFDPYLTFEVKQLITFVALHPLMHSDLLVEIQKRVENCEKWFEQKYH